MVCITSVRGRGRVSAVFRPGLSKHTPVTYRVHNRNRPTGSSAASEKIDQWALLLSVLSSKVAAAHVATAHAQGISGVLMVMVDAEASRH